MDELNYLQGKSVLISGCSGFVGSHLGRKVKELGGIVHATQHETEVTVECADYVWYCDLRNMDEVLSMVEGSKPDFVFHLASQAIVTTAQSSARTTLDTNIVGTINLLEALARYAEHNFIDAVVCASTDKVYGRHPDLPYYEGFSLLGTEQIYETSKNCEDILSQMAFHSWGLPIGITRCSNIYGPGDMNFSRIIPGMIKSGCMNDQFIVRSNGQHYRDFTYIDDIIDGYIFLAEYVSTNSLKTPAIFNFGTELPARVMDVVGMIHTYFPNCKSPHIESGAKDEIHRQYVAATKAEKELHWKPKVKLKQGIDLTVDWYKNFFSNVLEIVDEN